MKKIIIYLLILTSFLTGFSQEKASVKKDTIVSTQTKILVRNGNKWYNDGKYAQADAAYKKAIDANATYDKANYNYGNTQFLQNKMKEAKAQFEQVAKTTKDRFIKADSYHNLGNIAMKEKQYAPAVEAYKNALRNNPKDDETRYNLALAQKLLKEQQQKDKDKKDKKKDDKDDKKDDKDQKKDDKKDKDKDKKDDKSDKKDDKGDKDKENKDKKDENKDNNGKDKKDKQQQQPQQNKLSPDQVKQLLEAMNKEENKTQQKINARKERGRKVKQDKDW